MTKSRNKIPIVAAFLAVMFVMTGIASAISVDINKGSPDQAESAGDPINVAPGATVNFSLKISAMVNDSDLFNITAFSITGPPPLPTIALKAPPLIIVGGNFHLRPSGMDPYIAIDSFNVTTDASAPNGTSWTLFVEVKGITPLNGEAIDTASASRTIRIFIPPANISGTKFHDLNQNGTRDAGEPGLVDWTIELKNSSTGAIIATTSTDANGDYKFSNLPVDNYTVQEVLQAGWTQTAPTPIPPGNYSVTLAGVDVTGKDFGNYKKAVSISGMKFHDFNQNGTRDAGEPGLGGWTIDLNFTNGTIFKTTTTASDGSYKFTDVPPGDYIVQEIPQPGWTQTAPKPVPPGNYSITVTDKDITGLDFGNFKPKPPGCEKPECKITGVGYIPGKLDAKATFGIAGRSEGGIVRGNLEYQDNGLRIRSTAILSVITSEDKKKGWITGLAQVNGSGSYPFEVYVEDNGDARGVDWFEISVPAIGYSNGNLLSFGYIHIWK